MKLLYDNKILTATITTNSEDDNYPLENIQDGVRAKKYRSVTDTGIYIKISTRITANYLVIDGHNIPTTATVKFQAHTSDSWGSPDIDYTITVTDNTIVYKFGSIKYDFWRITIDDAGDSNTDYVEIGTIFLGTAAQLPGVKADQSMKKATASKSDVSEAGAQYGDRRLNYRRFAVNFPNISWADRTAMLAVWDNNLNVVPMYVLMWADRIDLEAIAYCVLDQAEIDFKKSDSPIFPFSTSLTFREVF